MATEEERAQIASRQKAIAHGHSTFAAALIWSATVIGLWALRRERAATSALTAT